MSVPAEHLRDFFNNIGMSEDANTAEVLRVKALEAEQAEARTKGMEIPSGIRTLRFKPPQAMTKADFRREFELGNSQNIEVTSWAWKLTDKFELTGQAPDLTLAFPTGRDLGLTRAASYETFLKAVQSAGLTKLHPEMALYMRRFYDQPLNEVLWLAMDPIIPDGRVDPEVLELGRNVYWRWLDARWTCPARLWRPEDRFACGVSK